MQVKRLLWLYNHVSLMKSEVKIIKELGYEVYIPKKPPFDVSINIDWESDKALTIPDDKIAVLNQTDFYDKLISTEVMNIMNQYFSIVIFGPHIEPVKSLVLSFEGILLFHPFGLEEGMTYTQIFQDMGGDWLMLAIERLGKRFWFGQSYDNLHEIECDYFANHAVDLPIGMLDTTIDNGWNGKKKKILFICPRIKVNSYYESVYKEFKQNFCDLPFAIGGVQPIKDDNDSSILGYLPQEEYDNLYYDYAVMFYHSMEPHHVHYHPFEAVKKGMPLIFMAGGLLDHLGGANLPGRAVSIREARKKCKRILDGDIKFIQRIRKSQKILLEPMRYEFCKAVWEESLKKIELESAAKVNRDKISLKRVGVILPLGYTGGVLDYTIRILHALAYGIKRASSNIELVVGHLDDEIYKKEDYFKRLREAGIAIRTYKWEEFTRDRLCTTLKLEGYARDLYENKYILPNDGINYFRDCEYLLFMSDHIPGHAVILRPYGVVLHDYIQRYIPELLKEYLEREYFEFARSSALCYTTTENTRQDAINYAGISQDKIKMLPLFFETIDADDEFNVLDNYFVWSTNISIHKNHKKALEALELYYQNGGSLKCYITGTNTNKFLEGDSENKYVNEVREIIYSSQYLMKNIKIQGYMKKKDFVDVLKSAKFFFHPGYADNGNGTAFDAAMLGVPSLSSDYPAMRNMDQVCKLSMCLFDPNSSHEMAETLMYGEKNWEMLREQLPQKEELKKHTVQDAELCEKIYKILLGCIGA